MLRLLTKIIPIAVFDFFGTPQIWTKIMLDDEIFLLIADNREQK